jgi:hypothetical protein
LGIGSGYLGSIGATVPPLFFNFPKGHDRAIDVTFYYSYLRSVIYINFSGFLGTVIIEWRDRVGMGDKSLVKINCILFQYIKPKFCRGNPEVVAPIQLCYIQLNLPTYLLSILVP